MDRRNGKFSGRGKNPYVDRRESKNQEIRRALVHKARLRKNYFKELEKQGEAVPEKRERTEGEEPRRKPVDFKERARLIKQRKEAAHKERLQRIEEKKKQIAEREARRIKNREALKKTNKYGQPLMGPRIDNLLDKIKKECTARKPLLSPYPAGARAVYPGRDLPRQ